MSHILVVDDDIHIGNLLQEALEAEGFRVSRAYSGTEAVLALDRERPDLILLDLMLPGLSGEQVLPRLASPSSWSAPGRTWTARPPCCWGARRTM